MKVATLAADQTGLTADKVDPQSDGSVHPEPPVFIVGIMERSGTNFLSDVLLIDPSFAMPSILNEDFVMEHAHLLLEYGDRTYGRWRQLKWIENPGERKNLLLRHLGQGIVALLRQEIAEDKRLLAKTPGAYNSDKFFHLFPDAKMVILIRDGRDAVESAVQTWPNKSYEFWTQQWARGARSILDLMEARGDLRGQSWHLVKYEDLVAHPETTVTELLSFVGVDPSHFDWGRLQRLPIHGSSQYRDEKGTVTGRKIEKTADFKPVGRWNDWGWFRKRMFKKLAGTELVRLEYVQDNRW
jgi:hypothetical protein